LERGRERERERKREMESKDECSYASKTTAGGERDNEVVMNRCRTGLNV